jgi:hypothetical protein
MITSMTHLKTKQPLTENIKGGTGEVAGGAAALGGRLQVGEAELIF